MKLILLLKTFNLFKCLTCTLGFTLGALILYIMPISQGAASVLGSLGSSVIGGLSNAIGKSSQFSEWKRAYDIQRADAIADRNFSLYVAKNNGAIQRQSAQSGGFNAALGSNNLGNTSINTNSSNGNDFGFNPVLPNFGEFGSNAITNALLLDSQKENIDSSTEKNRADARRSMTDNERANEELDVYRRTKDTLVKTADQTLQNMVSQGLLTQKQFEQITKGFTLMDAQIDSITSQTERFKQATPLELSKLSEQINQLRADIANTKSDTYSKDLENSIKRVESYLANMGFFVGQDFGTNLLSVGLLGKSQIVVNKVLSDYLSTISDLSSKLSSFTNEKIVPKGKEIADNLSSNVEKYVDDNLHNFHKPYRVIYYDGKGSKPVVYWRTYDYKRKKWNQFKAKTQTLPFWHRNTIDNGFNPYSHYNVNSKVQYKRGYYKY